MSALVVDTSMVVQLFLPEEHSEAATRLFDGGYDLHVPSLMFLELDNVLCRHVRRGLLPDSKAETIRRTARKSTLQLHRTTPLLDSAFTLASQSRCSMYDAVFLTLAVLIDGRMITADRRLVRSIQPGPWSQHLVWIGDFVSY